MRSATRAELICLALLCGRKAARVNRVCQPGTGGPDIGHTPGSSCGDWSSRTCVSAVSRSLSRTMRRASGAPAAAFALLAGSLLVVVKSDAEADKLGACRDLGCVLISQTYS